MGAQDAPGDVGVHDVPRRGRRPAGDRLPGRQDAPGLPAACDRRPSRDARRGRRLGGARQRRREQAGEGGHRRGLGARRVQPRRRLVWARRASAGASGSTCRRCSRPSAWRSSSTSRATTGCGRCRAALGSVRSRGSGAYRIDKGDVRFAGGGRGVAENDHWLSVFHQTPGQPPPPGPAVASLVSLSMSYAPRPRRRTALSATLTAPPAAPDARATCPRCARAPAPRRSRRARRANRPQAASRRA